MYLYLFIAIVGLSACTRQLTPFTSGLVENQSWAEQDLRKIQYYLSDDVHLERQVRKNASEIVLGEIILKDGRQIEQLILRKGTPGVLVQMPKSDKLGISFEPDRDDRFLIFTPHPKRNGTFVLSAQNWSEGRGQLSYGGNTYYTIPGAGLASLEVDLKANNSRKVSRREIGGRTIK